MSLPTLINLAAGLALLWFAWDVFSDSKRGSAIVGGVRRYGQGIFGEDWHVHEYIVGGVLLVAGIFFCAIAFSIFASHHDWWVLKWL